MSRAETPAAFLKAAARVDKETANCIADSMVRISNLLALENTSATRKAAVLKQIYNYLQKKANDLEPIQVGTGDLSLRKLRNELAHSKYRRDVDLSSWYPELWKAIGRLGVRLGPTQIENLLAYTLDVPNMQAAGRGVPAAKIVQMYRPLFSKLDSEAQQVLFVNLLLRLFTDSDSLSLLETRSER
ncbi:hypothetical protein [Acidovorax sp.]|uniref:hypothetical protein n=1 Tax=Acidovorax sp. TaxID=1872122 RepID=UPI002ACDA989|nr:hypothetical protein [Acidovorax sp.]MDZ7864095.1 hypothetical protein [Acidovorax sp.]